jgi:hypothetical protein
MAVAIAPTAQDTWPTRVALAVSGLTIGDQVTVYRVVAGVRAVLRGADHVTVAGTTLAVTDAELPFGLPVTWTVAVNGSDAASTTPSDLRPGGRAGRPHRRRSPASPPRSPSARGLPGAGSGAPPPSP